MRCAHVGGVSSRPKAPARGDDATLGEGIPDKAGESEVHDGDEQSAGAAAEEQGVASRCDLGQRHEPSPAGEIRASRQSEGLAPSRRDGRALVPPPRRGGGRRCRAVQPSSASVAGIVASQIEMSNATYVLVSGRRWLETTVAAPAAATSSDTKRIRKLVEAMRPPLDRENRDGQWAARRSTRRGSSRRAPRRSGERRHAEDDEAHRCSLLCSSPDTSDRRWRTEHSGDPPTTWARCLG